MHHSLSPSLSALSTTQLEFDIDLSGISREQYSTILKWINTLPVTTIPLCPILFAGLGGESPARIISSESGDSFVIAHNDGFYFFGGEASPQLLTTVFSLYLELSQSGRRVLIPLSKQWELLLRASGIDERRRISFNAPTFKNDSPAIDKNSVPEHIVIKEYSSDIAQQNLDLPIVHQLARGWGSLNSSESRGKMGFAVVRSSTPQTIASLAASFASSEHGVEIIVATRPDERHRGLSKLASTALLQWCYRTNRIPCWSCFNDNTASIALASGLGFSPRYEYPTFILPSRAS